MMNQAPQNSSSIRSARNACIASILQVGIYYSDQTPTNRPSIGDALKELQAKFQKHLHHEGGHHQLAEV
jgi:hypothetical protein